MTQTAKTTVRPLCEHSMAAILRIPVPKRNDRGKDRRKLTRHERVAEIFGAFRRLVVESAGNPNAMPGAKPPKGVRRLREQLGLGGKQLNVWWERFRLSVEENRVVVPDVGRRKGFMPEGSRVGHCARWIASSKEAILSELGAKFTLDRFAEFCRTNWAPRMNSRLMRRALRRADLPCASQVRYGPTHRAPREAKRCGRE